MHNTRHKSRCAHMMTCVHHDVVVHGLLSTIVVIGIDSRGCQFVQPQACNSRSMLSSIKIDRRVMYVIALLRVLRRHRVYTPHTYMLVWSQCNIATSCCFRQDAVVRYVIVSCWVGCSALREAQRKPGLDPLGRRMMRRRTQYVYTVRQVIMSCRQRLIPRGRYILQSTTTACFCASHS